jgi:hypothetical protein
MREKPMPVSLDEIGLAVVVNLETLREVLTKLSINGRRWWIASDPADAVESGSLTIGHGDRGCSDRLNTLYYRVPILNIEVPIAGIKKLVLLLDSSVVSSEQPGIYMENGRILEDYIADLESFFSPIKRALVEMLRTG